MTTIIIIKIIIIIINNNNNTEEVEEWKVRPRRKKKQNTDINIFLLPIGPSRPLLMFSSDRLNMKREYRFRCDPKKHVIGNLLLSSEIGVVWEPVNCC